ncbi:MAG: response regulator [Sphingomicrobium sp.]
MPPTPGIAQETRPAKILVVDDDERNLLAMSEVLSGIAQVVTAVSGSDALRLLLREEYAVILLDVFMPGLDGYETATLIRGREQTARIPIIFLSAVNKETEHLMRGYEMGAVDYVFKPVEAVVLRSKVGVFVDLYQMRRQVEEQALAEQQLREAHYHEQLSRIEVERQLENAERRQATILRSLPMAIYEADDDGGGILERTFVGGDLAHFLGTESQQVLNGKRTWDEWLHPEDRDRLSVSSDTEGDSISAEYRWIGPDGTMRYLLDQRVVIGSDPANRRWAGTLLDITERKQLEAQLVHVGKLDALGQLTGGVAHDFNNLLAAILGGLHVLERRLPLEQREQLIVGQMRHAAEQGSELVRRMMAFARQQTLTPVSVDPASLCESVAGLVSHTLGGKVTIDWQCPEGGLNLFVDRGQLELALMNLIINARDAMPDGGAITVSIEACADNSIAQPALRIRVADEGVGIPNAIVERVTEPFFTTKETGKGTGLGLSMVAGFVHQSGGRLHIESSPGKGARIDLLLPATDAVEIRDSERAEASKDWLSDQRLLLIDDDDSVRLVLAEQFRDAGGKVDAVASGKEAIKAVSRARAAYDFILSDLAMPDMDGLETLRALTKLAPEARMALMTGYADEGLLGADVEFPVLRKPLDVAALCRTLA